MKAIIPQEATGLLRAAALRHAAAHPQSDPELAKLMLETAKEWEAESDQSWLLACPNIDS